MTLRAKFAALVLVVGVGFGWLCVVQAARAGTKPVFPCNKTLPAKKELACARANLKHSTDVLRFLQANRHYKFGTAASRLRLARDHAWLRKVSLQRIAEAKARLNPWPAHHLLWLCIHGTPSLGTPVGHEASRWDTRAANGHYGGLQMHPEWGYGTSKYASDDPQLVQENAAEKAYRESGYNPHFLTQQWGQTIAPCWRYA